MTLEEQKAATIADLDAKRFREDWHGVRDACVDIEILNARIEARDDKRPARRRH
jgi:hypothetical protein